MSLNDVVQVNIAALAGQVTQAGFGVPLILGGAKTKTLFGGSTVMSFTSPLGLTSLGYAVTDRDLAAQALCSQNPCPPTFMIGKRVNLPTQAYVITPPASPASVAVNYTLNINEVAYTFTTPVGVNTPTSIVAGLVALPGFSTACTGFTIGGTTTLTLTATVAGNWLGVATVDPTLLAVAQNHADPGVATDLAAIQLANNTWYGLLSVFQSSYEIAAIAAWTEASGSRLYMASSSDSGIELSGAADIASTLMAAGYARTAIIYHRDSAAFPACGWMGDCLPDIPGSETWKFKTIAGLSALPINPTEQGYIQGKNCNYYYTLAGLNITTQGVNCSNTFIDVCRGRDALQARIQTRVYSLLANSLKVPYTDPGIQAVRAEVLAALYESVTAGFLTTVPAPQVFAPTAASVASSTRQSRVLMNITFTAQIAGAIHSVIPITGVLSY